MGSDLCCFQMMNILLGNMAPPSEKIGPQTHFITFPPFFVNILTPVLII
jgi:hypothetical protein